MLKTALIGCMLAVTLVALVTSQPTPTGCGNRSPFPADAAKYVEVVNGQGFVRSCAAGTKYNAKTCSCSDLVETALAPGQAGGVPAASGTPSLGQVRFYMPWRRSPMNNFWQWYLMDQMDMLGW